MRDQLTKIAGKLIKFLINSWKFSEFPCFYEYLIASKSELLAAKHHEIWLDILK